MLPSVHLGSPGAGGDALQGANPLVPSTFSPPENPAHCWVRIPGLKQKALSHCGRIGTQLGWLACPAPVAAQTFLQTFSVWSSLLLVCSKLQPSLFFGPENKWALLALGEVISILEKGYVNPFSDRAIALSASSKQKATSPRMA